MFRRIVSGLGVLLAVVAAAFATFVASRQHLRFDAAYPAVEASRDSAVVERGRTIVRDLAVCTSCHGDPSRQAALESGDEVPLSGGRRWDIPPGRFYARNITPDPETGLGKVSDAAVARALRFGVGHDGRALLPFMSMQGLTDDDLIAVVSYLRAQPPVRNPVPDHEYNLLGRIVKATVLANPAAPGRPPEPASPRGATVENGRYLAEAVAGCGGCHTQHDIRTGAITGPAFGGATGLDETADGSWSPPNITMGGRLAALGEEAFVARFRAGPAIPGTPMPWAAYRRMKDDDLRAIHRYLKTVPPATADVGPPFVPKKKG